MLELAAVMKQQSNNCNGALLFFMLGLLVVLVGVSAWLFQQTRDFQARNRTLIIQNDSLMAVNIELLQEIETKSSLQKKQASFSLKASNK